MNVHDTFTAFMRFSVSFSEQTRRKSHSHSTSKHKTYIKAEISEYLIAMPKRRVLFETDTMPHLQDIAGVHLLLNGCKASIILFAPE